MQCLGFPFDSVHLDSKRLSLPLKVCVFHSAITTRDPDSEQRFVPWIEWLPWFIAGSHLFLEVRRE